MNKGEAEKTGWARHQHFGLRREWLELYLADKKGWPQAGLLGNRQVDALRVWLKTAGLADGSGRPTWLDELFTARGTGSLELWELLWVNVVFNFPTAGWYARLGPGQRTTSELRYLLQAALPLANWTISNAVMELAGLLERTPVGRELGQGEVSGGRPRRLTRRGTAPTDAAIMMAVGRLYLKEQRSCLKWDDDLIWPWTVFGCGREAVLARLFDLQPGSLELNETGVIIRNLDREWWECGSILTTLR
ncbi:hypothetical protein [Pelotomaculum propionicicum]|uniref:DUF4007 domain-containing protein n=1 Tax=Pelotomaculum propionicicum TaxID=258475 RepID=A0A4Y7RYI0_9FIRM|nr:hypothetical protein [Pelotomaculum propionicicum]TEB13786.1 hypothetical protein Pmgp_00194 [Pelotomaculum propionicicum]